MFSYSELRDSLSIPRVHPNGFIQLNLDDTGTKRLHVWPEIPLKTRKVPMPIHDHIYDFESEIIMGEMVHFVYEVECSRNGAYHLYDVPAQSTKKDALLERMDNCLYATRLVQRLSMVAGRGYAFKAFRFHESVSVGLTATIFSVSVFDPMDRPRLLCAYNQVPDNTFRRDSHDPEFLWEIIRKVCR